MQTGEGGRKMKEEWERRGKGDNRRETRDEKRKTGDKI
jgi:hypothetical protein